MEKPIQYRGASLRYFAPNEHHVSRRCSADVLVLVFDGVLRFTEDGQDVEVHPGEYYIQRKGGIQRGDKPSDVPKYMYIHFEAQWGTGCSVFPFRGNFAYHELRSLMEMLDNAYHTESPYIEQITVFYEILRAMQAKRKKKTTANEIAEYLARESTGRITLDELCREFHFSKNHIIHLFRKEYGMTPVAYINRLRLRKAESLLEITSDSIEQIAYAVGFANYSHFYRLFCQKNEMSPRQWREWKRL